MSVAVVTHVSGLVTPVAHTYGYVQTQELNEIICSERATGTTVFNELLFSKTCRAN